MLQVEGLRVSVKGRRLFDGINLEIRQGETVALFGPNGCGKTSLLKTILGLPGYIIEAGRIIFKGVDITRMPLDARARMGLGMAFQLPPSVRGVRLNEMLRICMERRGQPAAEADIDALLSRLNLQGFNKREINLGYSGGEIKRSELVQLLAQDPDLLMLDEPDSGVDLTSICLVADVINDLLQKKTKADKRTKSGLIISHSGHILNYVNADRAYVMIGGVISCSGNPRDIFEDIKSMGYEGCAKCLH